MKARLKRQFSGHLLFLPLVLGQSALAADLTNRLCEQAYSRMNNVANFKNPARDEWKLGADWEKRIEEIFNKPGLTPEQRTREAFETLLKARVANSSAATRWLMDDVIEDAIEQKSLYSKTMGKALAKIVGPHYNTLFNRTSIPMDEGLGARRYLLAVHEVEHAFHRNSNPADYAILGAAFSKELFMVFRTPVSPIVRRRIEMRAVGAQWELASRIRPEFRRKLVEEMKKAPPVLGRTRETARELASAQRLFSEGLVSELRANLAKVGLSSRNPDVERLLTRFLLVTKRGSAPYLQSMVRKKIDQGTLSAAEKAEVSAFFDHFFSRRDKLLSTPLWPRPQQDLQFRASLSDQDLRVFERFLRKKRDSKYSLGGDLEKSINEVFVASLENAHLSKSDFIDRIAPIHGYSMETLAKDHLSLNDGWKASLTISTALYTALAAATGDDLSDPESLSGAEDLKLLIRLLASALDDPNN